MSCMKGELHPTEIVRRTFLRKDDASVEWVGRREGGAHDRVNNNRYHALPKRSTLTSMVTVRERLLAFFVGSFALLDCTVIATVRTSNG